MSWKGDERNLAVARQNVRKCQGPTGTVILLSGSRNKEGS